MSSLQSLETQRGICSCRSQVNGAALQKQPRLALAVLGLCSPSRRSVPRKGLRIVWLWRLNGLIRQWAGAGELVGESGELGGNGRAVPGAAGSQGLLKSYPLLIPGSK